MDFLTTLNAKQLQAVTAPKEPIMVLAGPGTGKTRTLVARILYLLRSYEIAPHKILAVTFTNKAKDEMRSRLREELGDTANDLLIGTFHRYCLEVLRVHHDEAGLPKKFAIADDTAQLIALSRASRILDERSLRTVMTTISSYRMNKANLNPRFQEAASRWLTPYHQELQRNGLIDFDQILLLTRTLFSTCPDLVESEQERFEAILVDEFQDTDPVQYEIMRVLAQPHRNIFAVADDDQSIFAWRGANVENIKRYVDDFHCRESMVILEENYRSAQCIIDIAARLLHDHRLEDKAIYAVTASALDLLKPNVKFLAFDDDEAEFEFIQTQIQEVTASDDNKSESPQTEPALRYSDIAILYPNHAIGEGLETKLLSARIPCQLVKHQGIFDQDDVRKMLLLLKLLQNPEDDVALEQYFELELKNALLFQQIKSFRTKTRTFKQTLQYVRYTQELSGISKGQFHKLVSTCFGLISNLLSYLQQNPQGKLEELINTICNLTQLKHAASIHNKARELRDPLDLPGMKDAVDTLLTALRQGQTIAVSGASPEITDICTALLNQGTEFEEVPAPFVALAPETDAGASLVLCVDSLSEEKLMADHPQGSAPRRLVLVTGVREEDLPDANSSSQEHLFGEPRRRAATSLNACRVLSPYTSVVTVFKLLQALSAWEARKPFRDYVVLDLETTSGDTRTTGIVEIGAVKVRDGKIVDKFSFLVNPEMPITRGAYKVHGISDDDVRDQPTFAQLLPDFLAFIENDLLVAHNGFGFDFPILWRLYRKATGKMFPNRRFDTLPLARRLFPGKPASVDALMQRFQIQDVGGRHRALDDTVYLAPIFERLQEVELSLNRRTDHEALLELVALGCFCEQDNPETLVGTSEVSGAEREERLLFGLGIRKLLSRFSELPDMLTPLVETHRAALQILCDQLFNADGAQDADAQAAPLFRGQDVAIARLKEVARAFSSDTLLEAIQQFLDHATLYSSQDDICPVNAVNLLTIHSAKGLEFPIVFVAGVEKGNLPSFYSVREEGELRDRKLDEQRRLFYVAMTRAKQQLFVTYVNKRGDYPKKRSQFLIELGVESDGEGV